MNFPFRTALMAVLLFSLAGAAPGQQVQTGTPPLASFAGGPVDTINLENLNVYLRIPILRKAGRGLPLGLNLLYNGTVWTVENNLWEPALNPNLYNMPTGLSFWGWYFQPLGYVTASGAIESYCADQYSQYAGEVVEITFSYTDPEGTSHQLPGYVTYTYGACGNSQPEYTGTVDDGSGISITASLSGGATVTDRHGRQTFFAPDPNYSGTFWSPVETDTNGNQMSFSQNHGTSYNETVTDTLGRTVTLTGAGTPSSPAEITYTDPNGNAASYSIKFTSQTVKTNFGCIGETEYGPTAQNLVSEIDLPDGSKYTFAYEPTPGYSGDVTGRLASVTVPAGGTISYVYGGGPEGTGVVCGAGWGEPAITIERYTPDTGSSYWTYAGTPPATDYSTSFFTTVTDPQGNATVVDYMGFKGQYYEGGDYEVERQIYQGAVGGNLLETIYTCYNGAAPPCTSMPNAPNVTQKTVYNEWQNGEESETNTVLDKEGPNLWDNYYSYGLVTEKDDYDYGDLPQIFAHGIIRRFPRYRADSVA